MTLEPPSQTPNISNQYRGKAFGVPGKRASGNSKGSGSSESELLDLGSFMSEEGSSTGKSCET
jgi:hypothetical protein